MMIPVLRPKGRAKLVIKTRPKRLSYERPGYGIQDAKDASFSGDEERVAVSAYLKPAPRVSAKAVSIGIDVISFTPNSSMWEQLAAF
jgi:hypothetical protein